MTDISGERTRLAATGLVMERREVWGSRIDYTSDRSVTRPARYLFLHIAVIGAPGRTATSERVAMRTIETIGQARFGIGASYNAAACQSGRLYELQPLTRRGTHTVNDKVNPALPEGSLNGLARALVLPQNVGDEVTDAQIDAAARWGAALRLSGEANRSARWYGHRDVTAKDCPGQRAYDRLAGLRSLTDRYTADGLGEEDDMTDAQDKLLKRINESLGALREHEKAHYDAVQKRLDELEAKVAGPPA